mgnify:CR=1 FL=1
MTMPDDWLDEYVDEHEKDFHTNLYNGICPHDREILKLNYPSHFFPNTAAIN